MLCVVLLAVDLPAQLILPVVNGDALACAQSAAVDAVAMDSLPQLEFLVTQARGLPRSQCAAASALRNAGRLVAVPVDYRACCKQGRAKREQKSESDLAFHFVSSYLLSQ